MVKSVGWSSGTKDLLDHIHDPGPGSRFRSAGVVGAWRNHPDLLRELVGGLSERLVLANAATPLLRFNSGCRVACRRRFCRGIHRRQLPGLLSDELR